MPAIVSLLILSFAVSLDGFGVGAMYGFRKIRMPLYALGIISLFSGCIIFTSMKIGQWLSAFFSPELAKMIGAVILMCIGAWAIYQMATQKDKDSEHNDAAPALVKEKNPETEPQAAASEAPEEVRSLVSIEIRRLGLIVQILRTPSAADYDRSGTISAPEAALLGLALSLDAFGAGIGAALIGYNPLLTSALIAAASGTFVGVGLRIGFFYADLQWIRRLAVLPGCILILMGLLKMM